MTLDPKARAVAIDALQQALGLDAAQAEEAFRNAQNLVHVRELLTHTPSVRDEYDDGLLRCPRCDAASDQAHARDCPIAAAWRALGDPRAGGDVEQAYAEAEDEQLRRGFYGPGEPTAAQLDAAHMAAIAEQLDRGFTAPMTATDRRLDELMVQTANETPVCEHPELMLSAMWLPHEESYRCTRCGSYDVQRPLH